MGRAAIVLAAGLGTRMKSAMHKCIHPVCGKPMILHSIQQLKTLPFDQILVVVGQQRASVEAVLGNLAQTVLQPEQRGTGHAVQCAVQALEPHIEEVVILYGDGPLIRAQTIDSLLLRRRELNVAATLLTADLENPFGLGRVLLDDDGSVLRIVEEKDASPDERRVRRVNSGMYAFRADALLEAVRELKPDNAQQEYYLTDTVAILRDRGQAVHPVAVADAVEILGVNDRVQLAEAESIMRRRIAEAWMRAGVTLTDPASTYIGADVQLAPDVTLLPGTVLEGRTTVGAGSVIGPNTRIVNGELHADVTVQYSVVMDSVIEATATVGPFAYIRPGSRIGQRVKVGDFVEIKNAVLGDDTKVSHLAYVGDADIGAGVNVGCGAITVNYDGHHKHRTKVGDNAFIGSNVNLIAPLTVGEGAYLCAGSTIAEDVPEDGFAIARTLQVTKPHYVKQWQQKRQAKRD